MQLNGANSGAVPAVVAATTGAAIATQTFSAVNSALAGANPFSVVTGTLPANITLNTANGQLTGTPVAGGNTNVTVRVATAAGNVDLPVQIQVTLAGAPVVAPPVSANATVGQAVNLAFTASNPAITAVGASGLPPGLSFVITNGGTGAVAITGTPTQSQAGGNSNVFSATLNATNGAGAGANAPISITVLPNVAPTLKGAVTAFSRVFYLKLVRLAGGRS